MGKIRRRRPKKPPGQGAPADATLRIRLARFLDQHQNSSLAQVSQPEGMRLAIIKPWGDESLALVIPENFNDLVEALNGVILPQRYSALWHRDTQDFEILWTAFPPSLPDIPNRSFRFIWREKEYLCEFAQSSERALLIAKSYEAVGTSTSNYRNLTSFKVYAEHGSLREAGIQPYSFWIRNIPWDEDFILVSSPSSKFLSQILR